MREVIDLSAISPSNLPAALGLVNNYVKVASMLWIRALGEPTLDGIVARKWSREVAVALRSLAGVHRRGQVLLRIDKRGKRWSARRGGYLIKVEEAKTVLQELNDEEMIAVFLEPWSPYRDLYCLASVVVAEQKKMIVEIVGPGFDTSDLVRGDLLPHKRFEISVPFESQTTRIPADLRRTHLVGPREYRRAVRQRLAKIGARLKNPSNPQEVLLHACDDGESLRKDALRYLKRTRQTLLLRHSEAYRLRAPPRRQ